MKIKSLKLLLVVALGAFMFACSGNKETKTEGTETPAVSTQSGTSDSIASNLPVVMDFYATWCPPCKALEPIMEEMMKKFEGKVDFKKIDVDQEKDMAMYYEIQSIPTILYVTPSGDITRTVGLLSAQELEAQIVQLIEASKK